MTIKSFFTACIFFCVTFSFGQGSKIDSLKTVIQNTDDLKKKSDCYWTIANEFSRSQVQYDSAYYYTVKAFEIAQELEDPTSLARSYSNFGQVYMNLGAYDKSLLNFEKSLEHFEDLGDTVNQSVINSSMASAYYRKENYSVAKLYFVKAITLSEKIQDSIGMLVDYANLGETELEMDGELLTSKEHLQTAKKLSKKLGIDFPAMHIGYAKILFKQDSLKAARKEVLFGLEIAKRDKDIEEIHDAYDLLYKIGLANEDYKLANEFLDKKTIYQDSIQKAKNYTAIENLKLQFQIEQQEEALEQLSQKRTYRIIIYALAGVGLLLLLVLVLRQIRIARMTEDIQSFQKQLLESELKKRNRNEFSNEASSFQSTLEQDRRREE